MIFLIAKKDFTLTPKANALALVWRISQKTGNPRRAPFPTDLMRNCLTAADQGPVLDLFIGSGSTAVMAEERGLDWAGIDVSASHLDMAPKHIAAVRRGGITHIQKNSRPGWQGLDVQQGQISPRNPP